MEVDIESRREVTGVGTAVHELSNDALIIALIQTLNHLSRWLTPIHDRIRLETSHRRSASSVKDLLIGLRDTESRAYALMFAIANQTNPDLDRVPRIERSPLQVQADRQSNALVIMSEFRRVRESTTSLLRALPDNAWDRGGFSRTNRDWTVRELAESLAVSDRHSLGDVDRLLSQSGLRLGIAEVSRVSLQQIGAPFAARARR